MRTGGPTPGGGGAAVWAPSGMSENDLAEQLAESFFGLRQARDARLGHAVLLARSTYRAGHHPLYMLEIYHLLGDPAMRWP